MNVQLLSDRIRNAAWQVCQELVPTNSAPSEIANVKCQQSLVLNTVAKIDNPALSSMFAGQQASDNWTAG